MFADARWSSTMLDQELVALVQSFLAKRSSSATPTKCLAWEEFFFRYDPIIRSAVRKIHTPQYVIDDISQDVWILLILKLPRWEYDPVKGAIGTWVTRTSRSVATKHARRRARSPLVPLNAVHAKKLVDPEPGPDIDVERMQEHELFGSLALEFAAQMHERDGRIVVMYWVRALALADIASELTMSEDAVWGVIRRARPELLDYLNQRGLGPASMNSSSKQEKVRESRR
jgi:RNA polymerase sigma factor (sigma-70 family)